MNTKFTPGPWKAHFEEAYYVTGPDLGRVAMMMNLKGAHGLGGRRHGDESAANNRLIASAPDLLALLTDVLAMHDKQIADIKADEQYAVPHPITERIRAAIARATGIAA